jgi:predicted nucleic acid binding AN1-type Zn finger protein
MSRIDDFVNKRIPGSMPLKAFVAAVLFCTAVAYPVFSKSPEESRQGHDYMSSEKPEAIRSSQEQLRKEYRQKRKEAELADLGKK